MNAASTKKHAKYQLINSIGQKFEANTYSWISEIARQQREAGYTYRIEERIAGGLWRLVEAGQGFF